MDRVFGARAGTAQRERAARGRPSFLAVAAIVSALAAPLALAAASTTIDPLDPLALPAKPSSRATQSVLIAATTAGARIVAVGESGVVLTSDDQGKTWKQAKVPVSVTLTGVTFATPRKGWAVGHSGVILTTTDGGDTWVRQLDGLALAKQGAASDAGGAGDPLLDVHFVDESNGFAVGSFGRILATRDGGRTWEDWRQHLPNPEGNHLYGMRGVGAQLYIVGERGAIFRSSDAGNTFQALKSPYAGSFFGVAATPGAGVLVYGLRGHAFRSDDGGQSWQEVKVGNGNAWLGAAALPDGRMVLVSQSGEVAVSRDGGVTFSMTGEHMSPLTSVVPAGTDAAVTVGMRGPAVIRLSAVAKGVVK